MKKYTNSGKFILTLMTAAFWAVMLAGCSKNLTTNSDSLYVPVSTDVTASATLADLQTGRNIYINSCGRCHGLYSPDSYSASNWKGIVPGMASRTGLTTTQSADVIKYVTRGK